MFYKYIFLLSYGIFFKVSNYYIFNDLVFELKVEIYGVLWRIFLVDDIEFFGLDLFGIFFGSGYF